MIIKRYIGIVLLMLASLSSFAKDDLKALYDSLDYSVAHKNMYVQEKIKRIDEIRSALSYANLNDVNKYVVYNQLYNEYWKFDLDSAIHYARLEVEAAIRMAKNLIDGKPAAEGTDCTVSDECDNLFYVPFEKVTPENVQDYAK